MTAAKWFPQAVLADEPWETEKGRMISRREASSNLIVRYSRIYYVHPAYRYSPRASSRITLTIRTLPYVEL